MKPYTLTFTVPTLPKMNSASGHTRGRHWAVAKRERKQWLAIVAAVTAGKRPERPLERARLTLVRLSSVEPDFDNLAESFKPVVDALLDLGVIVDDGPKHVERHYRWERVKPKRGHIGVKVEEIDTVSQYGDYDLTSPVQGFHALAEEK